MNKNEGTPVPGETFYYCKTDVETVKPSKNVHIGKNVKKEEERRGRGRRGGGI